jgi:hypothetical protein
MISPFYFSTSQVAVANKAGATYQEQTLYDLKFHFPKIFSQDSAPTSLEHSHIIGSTEFRIPDQSPA